MDFVDKFLICNLQIVGFRLNLVILIKWDVNSSCA